MHYKEGGELSCSQMVSPAGDLALPSANSGVLREGLARERKVILPRKLW